MVNVGLQCNKPYKLKTKFHSFLSFSITSDLMCHFCCAFAYRLETLGNPTQLRSSLYMALIMQVDLWEILWFARTPALWLRTINSACDDKGTWLSNSKQRSGSSFSRSNFIICFCWIYNLTFGTLFFQLVLPCFL